MQLENIEFKFAGFEAWEPHKVSYIDWKKSVVLLGDSTTYGFGLDEEDRLHNILDTDRPVNNFGYPGYSNEHIFKIFLYLMRRFGRPHKIVIGWSSPDRFVVVNDNIGTSVGHWVSDSSEKNFLVEHTETHKHRTQDFRDAIRLIDHDVHEWTVFSNMPDDVPVLKFIDVSKDKSHPGPKTMKQLASQIEL